MLDVCVAWLHVNACTAVSACKQSHKFLGSILSGVACQHMHKLISDCFCVGPAWFVVALAKFGVLTSILISLCLSRSSFLTGQLSTKCCFESSNPGFLLLTQAAVHMAGVGFSFVHRLIMRVYQSFQSDPDQSLTLQHLESCSEKRNDRKGHGCTILTAVSLGILYCKTSKHVTEHLVACLET